MAENSSEADEILDFDFIPACDSKSIKLFENFFHRIIQVFNRTLEKRMVTAVKLINTAKYVLCTK